MKNLLAVLILLITVNVFSQKIELNEKEDSYIITSEKPMLYVTFRSSDRDPNKNYEDSKVFRAGHNKIVIPLKYLKEDVDEVLIEYGAKTVKLEI